MGAFDFPRGGEQRPHTIGVEGSPLRMMGELDAVAKKAGNTSYYDRAADAHVNRAGKASYRGSPARDAASKKGGYKNTEADNTEARVYDGQPNLHSNQLVYDRNPGDKSQMYSPEKYETHLDASANLAEFFRYHARYGYDTGSGASGMNLYEVLDRPRSADAAKGAGASVWAGRPPRFASVCAGKPASVLDADAKLRNAPAVARALFVKMEKTTQHELEKLFILKLHALFGRSATHDGKEWRVPKEDARMDALFAGKQLSQYFQGVLSKILVDFAQFADAIFTYASVEAADTTVAAQNKVAGQLALDDGNKQDQALKEAGERTAGGGEAERLFAAALAGTPKAKSAIALETQEQVQQDGAQ